MTATLAPVFAKIAQYAPEMRVFAEQAVADFDHKLRIENAHLGPVGYLRQFWLFCETREYEWRERELHDYKTTGELMGIAHHMRSRYDTLGAWVSQAEHAVRAAA